MQQLLNRNAILPSTNQPVVSTAALSASNTRRDWLAKRVDAQIWRLSWTKAETSAHKGIQFVYMNQLLRRPNGLLPGTVVAR